MKTQNIVALTLFSLFALCGSRAHAQLQPLPNQRDATPVADIRIIGNKHIETETILNQIRTARGQPYSAVQVGADRQAILDLGFFAEAKFEVSSSALGMVVTFEVVEHEVIKEIVIEGNKVIPTSEILKVISSKVDEVLNLRKMEADAQRIAKLYDEKGYIGRVADADINPENGRLTLAIVEAVIAKLSVTFFKSVGDNGDIIPANGHRTKLNVITRELETKEGEVFNRETLKRDLRRLGGLSMIEDVSYKPKAGEEPGKIEVDIRIKERRSTGQAAFGLGVSSRGGAVGFIDLNQTNLGGMNRQFGVRAEFGDLQTFEVSFTEPWLDSKHTSLNVIVGDRLIFREPRSLVAFTHNTEEQFFEERRKGIRLTLARPRRNRNTTVFVNLRNEDVSLQTTDVNTFERDLQSFGRVAAVAVGFVKDTRRNVDREALGLVDPNSGAYLSLQLENAFSFLGGDSSFRKIGMEMRRYRPVGKRAVLAGRMMLGRAFGPLPAFEQFFIGGSETIRGYNIDHEFGDNQVLFNLELRYKLGRISGKEDDDPRAIKQPIQVVLFMDWGDAWGGNFANGSGFSPIFGFGVGFRVPTPIGPIRLDIGLGRDGARTHFGFGPLF
jgi:outer membrane protein insertion porin family